MGCTVLAFMVLIPTLLIVGEIPEPIHLLIDNHTGSLTSRKKSSISRARLRLRFFTFMTTSPAGKAQIWTVVLYWSLSCNSGNTIMLIASPQHNFPFIVQFASGSYRYNFSVSDGGSFSLAPWHHRRVPRR